MFIVNDLSNKHDIVSSPERSSWWAISDYFSSVDHACGRAVVRPHHYENTPIQIYLKYYHKKNWKFSGKNSDIFHMSAQNIDCGTR